MFFLFLLLIPFYCCGLALQLKVQSVSRNKTVDRRLKGVLTIHFCMYYLSFGKNNQNFLYPGIFKLWPAFFVLLKQPEILIYSIKSKLSKLNEIFHISAGNFERTIKHLSNDRYFVIINSINSLLK